MESTQGRDGHWCPNAAAGSLLLLSADYYWEQDDQARFTVLRASAVRARASTPVAGWIGNTPWLLPGLVAASEGLQSLRAAIAERRPYHDLELSLQTPGAQAQHLTLTGEPIFDAQGRCVGYRGVARDVTPQRRELEELRRYRSALDTSGDPTYLVDRATMRFIDVNATACKAAGYSRQEMLAMGPHQLLVAERETLEREYDEAIARSPRAIRIERTARNREGAEYIFELARRAVRVGERWTIVTIGRDITARRRAEALLHASEAKYRSILESIDEAYYEVDLKGRLVLCNSALSALLGRPMDDLPGVHYSEYIPQAIQHSVFESFNEVYRTGRVGKGVDWPMVHISGSSTLTEGSIHLVTDASGRPIGFRGILRDVTHRRQMESMLRDNEKRFRDLTQLSSDWYWEQGPEHRFTLVSEQIAPATGLAPADCLGRAPWDLDWLPAADADWSPFQATLAERRPFRELVLRRLTPVRYVSLNGQPIFDAAGSFQGYRGTGTDITERRLAEEQIRRVASHDTLTGLPNRTAFGVMLTDAVNRGGRFGRSFALMFIDLDGFKAINDDFGHAAGDVVLEVTAGRLSRCVRASDVVARLGGDEFTVLLRDIAGRQTAETVARKLIEETAREIVLPSGGHCRVTASVGLCIYPEHGLDEQTLMKRADAAMYRAKQGGKNGLSLHAELPDVADR